MLTFDPFFREFDRLTQQVFGQVGRSAVMPMDAWREGDRFVVEFDVPGMKPESLDLKIEDDVLTVSAERPADTDRDWLVAERPVGTFSRQVLLGRGLDADKIHAEYHDGVLRVTLPVAEEAKPRKIAIAPGTEQKAISV